MIYDSVFGENDTPERNTPVKARLKGSLDRRKGFLLVRVGSDSRPATNDDIQHVQSKMEEVMKDADLEDTTVLVTHHNIYIDWVDLNNC